MSQKPYEVPPYVKWFPAEVQFLFDAIQAFPDWTTILDLFMVIFQNREATSMRALQPVHDILAYERQQKVLGISGMRFLEFLVEKSTDCLPGKWKIKLTKPGYMPKEAGCLYARKNTKQYALCNPTTSGDLQIKI